MRILCTNDDGIHAPGLKTLETIARQLSDDVWVVAPETDQSGVSHSLSLNDPLRLREISERHFAVKGTPTDCVIMGVRHLMHEHRPDLVLSGVNRGQNVAEDVSYSGTVAGAIEGTILGVPSIALSQAYGPAGGGRVKWHCAEAHAAGIVRKVLEARHRQGHPRQRELPRLRARRGRRARPSSTRASATRNSCASTSAPTAAATLITGSPSRSAASPRATAPTCGRSRTGGSRSRRCAST